MSRTKIDWRSSSRENYDKFCNANPTIKLTFDQWRSIIYGFNEGFRDYILETGEKVKFPFGFGDFSINKKIRKKLKGPEGKVYVNLPVDWKKSREANKRIYNFNYHTDGYFFGWMWFKASARFKHADLWYFKPSRTTSRLLCHYITVNDKYQHIYSQWKI